MNCISFMDPTIRRTEFQMMAVAESEARRVRSPGVIPRAFYLLANICEEEQNTKKQKAMAETLRIFGFLNRWPGMTCVPLMVVPFDGLENFYIVYPGEGFTRGPLVEDDGTCSTPTSIRERESFVSAEGTCYEMKEWRKDQVAYLDRHGNPRVDLWENLILVIKEDLPHVVDNVHRSMLEDMLKEPA